MGCQIPFPSLSWPKLNARWGWSNTSLETEVALHRIRNAFSRAGYMCRISDRPTNGKPARVKDRSKDYDIRARTVRWLLDNRVPRHRIRHELPLDTASSDGRTDIVVLCDARVIGIEIKSGSDKLDRIGDQFVAGSQAFDDFWCVIDERHAWEMLGRRWNEVGLNLSAVVDCGERGFVSLDDFDFYHRHENLDWPEPTALSWPGLGKVGEKAPTLSRFARGAVVGGGRRTSPAAMSRLLWAQEASTVAARLGFDGRRSREDLLRDIRENCALAELRPLVVEQLLERVPNLWEQAFWARFDAEAVIEDGEAVA